ncbi:MAG: sigma-54 dependent transcriptional regulator, acetoin dehydrogenase operon transcriptional [Thermoanaerobacteraceae bacterium]|nr:sigma-54 dependent transcriptional regulator, acetoin dehydrogenase operon transcriptional [Thermoanaerobacteraceae bacterium]MDN5301672.1 sigma-54 dependent transcriptional regulator, acetoin dehydrogenase operon transcriptional [Thermoanaerobacteraceae bacterium]RKL64548.1 AAA family ATPase [Thermoanaerobacteraceae bacterium SP2]
MSEVLKNMQDTVVKYARVLSRILKVDVEIVDDRLNRIAGTGSFENRVNTDMSDEGYVYRTVLQTGEKKIIRNPGMHEICMRCPKRYHCEETFEISTPIKIGDEVIGVIGFVCFDQQQKNHILEDLDTYLEFLDQISDLISSKALEEIEKEKTLNAFNEKINTVSGSAENFGLDKILGESEKIKSLKEKVKKIARSSSTVLITGESGTGKELLARAIHMESYRADGPFVAINCAAIPETLLESELLGYTRGAFTGADVRGKMGKIELAHKGTLFFDEIGDMPLYLQSKLLRVLEQKEVTRLGSNKPVPVDVRFIAATNKDLERMIRERAFREDLYYRLNVIPLEVPPLRERKEDIEQLTRFFIEKYCRLFNKKVILIDDRLWEYMKMYDWPGNVRELENTVEYMVNMLGSDGIITMRLMPRKFMEDAGRAKDDIDSLEEMEARLIKRALNIYGRNVTAKKQVAKKLGIGMATLYRKLKKYGFD